MHRRQTPLAQQELELHGFHCVQTAWLMALCWLADVAYKQTGATQKNAAIAVARLGHDPICMQQIKELHGLEIIYQYVRP